MTQWVNGEIVEMTEEEIKERNARLAAIPKRDETQGDRIEAMLVSLCSKLGVEVNE